MILVTKQLHQQHVTPFKMLNKRVYFYLLLLLVFQKPVMGFEIQDDTLTIKPVVKKPKVYPYQPTVFKTSPTALLYGGVLPFSSEYRIMIEMSSNRTQSEQIAFSFIGKNIIFNQIDKNTPNSLTNRFGFKVSGWRLQYAHKFYVVNRRHHSPYGFYVAPLISYTTINIAVGSNRYLKNSYYDIRQFNINGIIGVQTGKKNRLTFDVYAGLGYKNNEVYFHSNTYKVTPFDQEEFGDFFNSNVNLVFGINLGFSI
jgi:hypothetical protein